MAMNRKRIIVTRPVAQANNLAVLLAEAGATPVLVPAISIHHIEAREALQQNLAALTESDWIAFASVNAVDNFFANLDPSLTTIKAQIAAVGDATALHLIEKGLNPQLQARQSSATGLAHALRSAGIRNRRILLPQAAAARVELAQHLQEEGAEVNTIAVYQTIASESLSVDLQRVYKDGPIDGITFASPSAVHALHHAAANAELDLSTTLPATPIFVIGDTTAATVGKFKDFSTPIIAEEPSDASLVKSIRKYFANIEGALQ